MWMVRVLTGPQAGKTFSLTNQGNILGRAPNCDITLPVKSISKEHARIDVLNDKLIVTDLGSRNGTFVNGVKVTTQKLRPNDKISLHDIILEVVPQSKPYQANEAPYIHPANVDLMDPYGQEAPSYYQNNSSTENSSSSSENMSDKVLVSQGLQGLLQLARNYIDNVVLPGVYKLPEWLEFKWVIALFVMAFIIFVTSLSSIPLMRILKASIEQESQRRALTIARILERVNRAPLIQGTESAVSVQIAQREPGVDKALIISNVDGHIIAPSSLAGQFPNIPFVHEARKLQKEVVEQIDGDTIGALVPISYFNSKTGGQTITAHAVILYNMGALAVDDGQTLSLFIQTFFIALVVGSLLFFFLFKLIEFPFQTLNEQLDHALKEYSTPEGHRDLELLYQFPSLQNLISNINSALNRMGSSQNEINSPDIVYFDRSHEIANLVQLIGFPALGISLPDRTVAAVNSAFEERTGLNGFDIVNESIDSLTDQALKLNLQDLVDRVNANPESLATNHLEFSGINFEIAAQAIYGEKEASYCLIALLPLDEIEEVAS